MASGAGNGQHAGRDVDPVNGSHAVAAQPGSGTAGAAAEFGGAADGRPVGFGEFVEEGKVHDVRDDLFLRSDPLAVAGGGRPPCDIGA
ncbi:hypothetical protein AB4212_26380 [Streptomyces sp. 2MCAF27]